MKIFIKTRVQNNLIEIQNRFNQYLFEKLSPPLVELKVLRFDGCLKDHEVHLEMNMFGIKNQWVSKITAAETTSNYFYFIDEGIKLPPPLKSWKHVHRVERINDQESDVIDDINFTTGNEILDMAIYPALYTMFKFRQPIYKRELK